MALAGVELTDFHRDRLSVWMNEAEQVDERRHPWTNGYAAWKT